MTPDILAPDRAELGECPVWDAKTGTLRWLDILNDRLFVTDPASGATTASALPRRSNCIARRASGGWIAAGLHEVHALDGPRLATLPPGTTGRFNDGKCDAAGRLWIGTATAEGHFGCALWRIDPDGTASIIDTGIGMSNGLGWSPDGTTFYHADSAASCVYAHDFEPETGTLSNRRPFYRTEDGIVPDGLCLDTEGHVWLALWGGYAVIRLTPEGREVARLPLPTPRVSSCAFGGPDMGTLFITTACEGASATERARDPAMGALFALRPGATGLPAHPFGG